MPISLTLRTFAISAAVVAIAIPLSLRAEDVPAVGSPPELRSTSAEVSSESEAQATTQPRMIVTEFFETLGLGKVSLAYEKLTKGSMIEENEGQLSMLRTKTDEAMAEFGRIEGHELVEMEWAGTSLVRLTYLSLGEKFPLRWRFYFYKRKGLWRLVDIRVDDRLKDLFHESGDSQDSR